MGWRELRAVISMVVDGIRQRARCKVLIFNGRGNGGLGALALTMVVVIWC